MTGSLQKTGYQHVGKLRHTLQPECMVLFWQSQQEQENRTEAAVNLPQNKNNPSAHDPISQSLPSECTCIL